MAKKKVARKPAKAVEKAPKGLPTRAKPARVVKKPAKPAKPAKAARKPRSAGESLGRPLVTAEEKLYLLFREDYHARQVFEFLRVATVGELEQFAPLQIFEVLSAPLKQTVDRIRERLADQKRHLRDDADFAREHLRRKA